MLKLALVGRDVSRSLSPKMHAFLLKEMGKSCRYELLSCSEAEFSGRIEKILETYDGLNVTIPYKLAILPHLRALSDCARGYGSVNTVRSRVGYNTDGGGFLLMLKEAGISVGGTRALVLGAGGAGRSCIGALLSAGADVEVYEKCSETLKEVSCRFPKIEPLEELVPKTYDLIVNCTGVGMHDRPNDLPTVRFCGESVPFPRALLFSCGAAVDLIYEPARSAFLREAASLGKKVVNGEAMLFYQAYLADCVFAEHKIEEEEAVRLRKKYMEEIK